MAVRGTSLFFSVSAIVAGIIIMLYGACTVGFAASPSVEWLDRVNTLDVVVPIGLILLAIGMLLLAYVYGSNLGYLASALLITLAVVQWVIHFASPTSELGVRAALITFGSILLVSMIVTCISLREVSFKLGSSTLMMVGYILILLFGILGGVGCFVQLSLTAGPVRAGIGLAGAGAVLGGIAGILLFLAFLTTFMGWSAGAPGAKPAPKAKGTFCAECGAPMSPRARFCPKCGAKAR